VEQFSEPEHFGLRMTRDGKLVGEWRWPKEKPLTFADCFRGVWKFGEEYKRGDTATWDGGTFLCVADTRAKPETKDWVLMVKRGRNGKDGKDGKDGAQGPAGPPGRDGKW
jgi:integrin beta 3